MTTGGVNVEVPEAEGSSAEEEHTPPVSAHGETTPPPLAGDLPRKPGLRRRGSMLFSRAGGWQISDQREMRPVETSGVIPDTERDIMSPVSGPRVRGSECRVEWYVAYV
jgi:hypothetical protein